MEFITRTLIKKKSIQLKNYGFNNAYNEIQWYLEHHNLITKKSLYLDESEIDQTILENNIDNFITKRISNIPFQYIINKTNFYGRDYYINKYVFIPRSETELFFDILEGLNFNDALDIGTGSGILAITLSLEKVSLKIDAIDICCNGLKVAKRNINTHSITNINIFMLMLHIRL